MVFAWLHTRGDKKAEPQQRPVLTTKQVEAVEYLNSAAVQKARETDGFPSLYITPVDGDKKRVMDALSTLGVLSRDVAKLRDGKENDNRVLVPNSENLAKLARAGVTFDECEAFRERAERADRLGIPI